MPESQENTTERPTESVYLAIVVYDDEEDLEPIVIPVSTEAYARGWAATFPEDIVMLIDKENSNAAHDD
jgi:hypothetical protein